MPFLGRFLSSWGKDEDGSAAVEFTFAVPDAAAPSPVFRDAAQQPARIAALRMRRKICMKEISIECTITYI